jgi:hypothetical protein
MIGAFPDLYPDELLCSGLGRYEAWMAYPLRYHLLEDLFGAPKVGLCFDLPGRLGYLAAALPPGHACTVDRLIDHHTLVPFYAPFLTAERVSHIRREMAGAQPANIRGLVGLNTYRVPLPDFFRYCPCCVAEDRLAWGECYWHRLHHAPGVEVCPHHQVWLETSTVPFRIVHGPRTFPVAEEVAVLVEPRLLNQANEIQVGLLHIAQDAQWLLNHPGLTLQTLQLQTRALIQLAERGLATYNGRIRLRQLVSAMLETLSPDFLKRLHCTLNVEQDKRDWLSRLLEAKRPGTFPLYGLLLIQFLGHSVETFLTLPVEQTPFGCGPWPCLNAVCPHYHQLHITSCRVEYTATRGGRPHGTFTCACGFSYSRIGPDRVPEDRFRIGKIEAVGSLWETKLTELWYMPDVNTKAMRRILGMDWKTLLRYAAIQGLPFPPPGFRLTRATKGLPEQIGRTLGRRNEDPTFYRQAWLGAMQQYPDAGINILRKRLSREYSWLRHYDVGWLNDHAPARISVERQLTPPNWAQRDHDLVQALEEAAARLKTRQEKPFRLSATALATEAGRRAFLRDYAEHLPLATAALNRLAETHENFALRRLWCIAEQFLQQGIVPRRRVLTERASVDDKPHRDNPTIQAAVDEILEWLKGGGAKFSIT